MSNLPLIEINIACSGWPELKQLSELVDRSVDAAIVTANLTFPPEAELSLLFDGDEAIRTLNRQFRDIDKPTNVLSFPGEDIQPGEPAGQYLGDVAFALETIKKEADLEGRLFDHHLSHLIIHGLLHLFGYDHIEADQAEHMEQLEIRALASLNIDNPYEGELETNAEQKR